MTTKLLSPEVLEECLSLIARPDATGGGLPNTASAIRAHIAALEADNAALGEQIRSVLMSMFTRNGGHITVEIRKEVWDGLGYEPGDHPGTTLLAEYAKALVRARNEGLEDAAAWAEALMAQEHNPSMTAVAASLRAMKESE